MTIPPPDTPPGDELEPEAEPESTVSPCTECGAALAPDQAYCLECGTPTPRAPRMGGRAGRAGVAVAVLLLVLGAGAAAAAYAVMADDKSPSATAVTVDPTDTGSDLPALTLPTYVGTGSLPPMTDGIPLPPSDTGLPPSGDFPMYTEQPGDPTAPADDPLDPIEPDDPIDPIDDPAEDPIDDPSDPVGGGSDWPAGTSGWTAIVSSVRDEDEARATADNLASSGEEAGVLFSSDHSGLRAGYWVVFSGNFATRAEAASHARALAASNPGAYPRHISG